MLHIQQEGVTDELANWSSILHSHNKMGQPEQEVVPALSAADRAEADV